MEQTALFESIRDAVASGGREAAAALAQAALAEGFEPLRMLEDGFTPALRAVGARWESGEIFLPEMILAAEATKAALRVLRAEILRRGGSPPAPRRCVLGTVRGDVHDIGKSIVAAMLEAAGFEVVDLGTDVERERFVRAAREKQASFVGLSALLTTTMPEMKAVIEALSDAGLRSGLRVVIGGAPVTREYAEAIGADGFAKDGVEAMRLFQRLAAPSGGAGDACSAL